MEIIDENFHHKDVLGVSPDSTLFVLEKSFDRSDSDSELFSVHFQLLSYNPFLKTLRHDVCSLGQFYGDYTIHNTRDMYPGSMDGWEVALFVISTQTAVLKLYDIRTKHLSSYTTEPSSLLEGQLAELLSFYILLYSNHFNCWLADTGTGGRCLLKIEGQTLTLVWQQAVEAGFGDLSPRFYNLHPLKDQRVVIGIHPDSTLPKVFACQYSDPVPQYREFKPANEERCSVFSCRVDWMHECSLLDVSVSHLTHKLICSQLLKLDGDQYAIEVYELNLDFPTFDVYLRKSVQFHLAPSLDPCLDLKMYWNNVTDERRLFLHLKGNFVHQMEQIEGNGFDKEILGEVVLELESLEEICVKTLAKSFPKLLNLTSDELLSCGLGRAVMRRFFDK